MENSSLVPWLTATALAHGLITQKSRGTLVRWNLFLAPLTFGLVLYATFLTRSGILSESSVHSFTDTGLGPFLVGGGYAQRGGTSLAPGVASTARCRTRRSTRGTSRAILPCC